MTKSAVSCGFGLIYWRNPCWKTSFFVRWFYFQFVIQVNCFTLFDTGQYGSNNDSGVLLNSKLGKNFDENKLGIPEALNLANCNFNPLPYYLLWDDIFSLKSWLIRPFLNQTWTKCKKFTIIANPVDVVSLKIPLEYFLLGGTYYQL